MTEHGDQDPDRQPADLQRRLGYLAEDVRRRLGPGARLTDDARVAFEGRLGGDLSGVMVHRGPLAGHLASSMGADALATGQHVLGGDAALDPSTAAGSALLGHELSHVLQRSASESGEREARLIERALSNDAEAQAPPAGAGTAIDLEALVERVYQRMRDQLRLERERAAWIP